MMCDLRAEHLKGASLSQRQIDWLMARGVPPLALGKPWALATDHVVFDERGSFEFARHLHDEEGRRVMTIGVEARRSDSAVPDVTDIVAWDVASGRLATWCGRAFALGQEQVLGVNFGAEPLAVWRSPLNWLRASRRGIVIVRPWLARDWLEDVADVGVVAEDEAHGYDLDELLLRKPSRFKVVVREHANERSTG